MSVEPRSRNQARPRARTELHVLVYTTVFPVQLSDSGNQLSDSVNQLSELGNQLSEWGNQLSNLGIQLSDISANLYEGRSARVGRAVLVKVKHYTM